MMKSVGYTFVTASSGEEALEIFEKQSFDCVFMDIVMPGIDGFETTAKIREFEKQMQRKPSVIIGLSGNARHEYIEKAIQFGMNDYLTKPARKQEIFKFIAKHFANNAVSN